MEANQRVGRWTLLEQVTPTEPTGSKKWRCKCDCGTIKLVLENSLKQRMSRSCGCLRREVHESFAATAYQKRARA